MHIIILIWNSINSTGKEKRKESQPTQPNATERGNEMNTTTSPLETLSNTLDFPVYIIYLAFLFPFHIPRRAPVSPRFPYTIPHHSPAVSVISRHTRPHARPRAFPRPRASALLTPPVLSPTLSPPPPLSNHHHSPRPRACQAQSQAPQGY